VKIYLLRLDDGRIVFHSEAPSSADGDTAESSIPTRGVRGWLERRGRALTESVARSEGSITSWFRRTWVWLHRWTAPDEELLRSLRMAEHFELSHPASLTTAATRHYWVGYLASRRRRHLFWLVVNLLILPPAVLAAVLPGPNVLGFWFAYRVLMHLFAWVGAGRARRNAKATTFVPMPELDAPVRLDDQGQLSRLAEQLSAPHLPAILRRLAADSALQPAPQESDATAHL
jgi:hypothetical protein